MTPCPGLGLPNNLIVLKVAVNGPDDAPAEFRGTLTTQQVANGFAKTLLYPCLWLQRSKTDSLQSFIVLDVDDLA